MDARDLAKRRYEKLRDAYKKREASLADTNAALIDYVQAVNEYHDALTDARRWRTRSLEGDEDAL